MNLCTAKPAGCLSGQIQQRNGSKKNQQAEKAHNKPMYKVINNMNFKMYRKFHSLGKIFLLVQYGFTLASKVFHNNKNLQIYKITILYSTICSVSRSELQPSSPFSCEYVKLIFLNHKGRFTEKIYIFSELHPYKLESKFVGPIPVKQQISFLRNNPVIQTVHCALPIGSLYVIPKKQYL